MIEQIIALALDEGKWLSAAMLLSLIAVLALITRQRQQRLPRRLQLIAALNLYFGGMIGIMSLGHLLAVTIKLFQGALNGSLLLLYPLGLVLAVPAGWLAFEAGRLAVVNEQQRKKMAVLNLCLGISLLAFGIHNWPLAAPAAWNIAYLFHSQEAVGRAIVTVAIIATLALFAGSLVFFVSGQSFEQFKGMP